MPSVKEWARPRCFAVAVLAFSLVVLAPATAGAHPYLVQTLPGPGAILRNPPGEIEIGFTEAAVLEGSSLRLEAADGRRIGLGPIRAPKTGPGLAADITSPPAGGVYTVRWVVLGDDGHTSSGDYRFGVALPGGAPPPGAEELSPTGGPSDQAAATDGPLRIILRWVGLLGASLLLGGAIFAARIRGRLDPGVESLVTARVLASMGVGWALTLVGAVAAVVAAAGAGAGDPRFEILVATDTGVLALARLGAVVVFGLPALVFRRWARRDGLLGLAGAVSLGAEAAGGHVTGLTSGRMLAGLAQATHLSAAGIWVGGLVVLALAVRSIPGAQRSAAWRGAARAFGPVAAVSAAVVIVTGTLAAVREVEYRYFLVWSGYGQVLLVKLALVAGMLALGGWVGLRLRRPQGTAARPRRSSAGSTTPAVAGIAKSLRTEAVLGVAVLVFAATLAGVAQGRGQPLPAQRESVLAGPAFANAVVGGGVARIALAPAAPGANRLTVLMGGEPVAAPAAVETPRSAAAPERVEVTLTCECRRGEVSTRLVRGSNAWHADVELAAEGIWRASLAVDGQKALAPVALRVAEEGAPGAAPVVIAAPADLSGKEAADCRSFQLGLLLSLGFLNADGGVNGRKVVLHSADDGGDLRKAGELARAGGDAVLAAPCGRGGRGAVEALAGKVPVVVADPSIPPVPGERIFRLAGDPFAEGWTVGRTVATSAFTGRLEAPRRMAVVVEEGDGTTDRVVAGIKAGLTLDPAKAEAAEGRKSENAADVEVEVLRRAAGAPLSPLVRQAVDGARYVAAFFRSDPDDTGAALDSLSDDEITLAAALLVSGPAFDERFYRSSKIGRRGDVTVLGEVVPDSEESLFYTQVVRSLFPGEQPTINGLRGWMAGKAITEALSGGASPGSVARRLQLLGLYSDGVVSGWSPAAPAAGSWRFFLYKGSFIPSGLQPGAQPEPGRYFPEGGAWSRVATGNVGLCGPQESFAGAAPECKAKPADEDRTKGS